MNVAVIAPHPDDESIGCGGTLCKHHAAGDSMFAVYLTSGELGLKSLPRKDAWKVREQEARSAARLLGIKKTFFLRAPDWTAGNEQERLAEELRRLFSENPPDLIYLPHPGEWHPDHKISLAVVRAALHERPESHPKIWAYEVWTPLAHFDRVEDITGKMPTKLQAIRCHQSQLHDLAYDDAVRGLNRYRGAMAGRCRYAEVFQSLSLS